MNPSSEPAIETSVSISLKPIPKGTLYINTISCEQINNIPFPKELMDSIVSKWREIFNTLLKKHKDVRILNACLDTVTFTNCYGVKFNSTNFLFDRITKEFELNVTPMRNQDILCFNQYCKRGIFIQIKSAKIRTVFTKFFEKINTIRFCPSCGSFSHSINYYSKLDMCETCLFNEITASHKEETFTCTICLEDGKKMYKTNCGHHFHRKCLSQLNPYELPRCPLCRKPLDPADEYIDNEENDDDIED